jgi:hypothetical protein
MSELTPVTREEMYLDEIANALENGGGGGGGGFTPTDAQLAAMNSGITSEDVEQIDTNKTNISMINNNLIYSPTQPTGDISDGAIWINTSAAALSDYIKKYHECTNLSPTSTFTNTNTDTKSTFDLMIRLYNDNTPVGQVIYTITSTGVQSYVSVASVGDVNRILIKHNGASQDINILDITLSNTYSQGGQFSFTADFLSIDQKIIGGISLKDIMINVGSTPLPYEPYTTTVWHSNNA